MAFDTGLVLIASGISLCLLMGGIAGWKHGKQQQRIPDRWLREERRRPEAFHGVTIRFPIDKRQ